jgi:signal transduction histidine kinase
MKAFDTREFLATLAHDIRGPLTSIAGFAELLEEGALEGPDATDAAKTIRLNAERLAALAGDLALLARVDAESASAHAVVDCTELVREAVEQAPVARTIEAEYATQSASVYGDAELLRSAFGALLRNAMKYAPRNAVIRVRLTEDGAGYAVAIEHASARGIGYFLAKAIFERHGSALEVANGWAAATLRSSSS